MRKKPPGYQTALDLCILDLVKCRCLGLIYSSFILDVGLFYGKLELKTGDVMLKVYFTIVLLQVTTTQVILILKATMIFKGEWINELSDEAIKRIFRFASILYTITITIFDARPGQEPASLPFLQLLTGLDQPP